jgi:ribosomal protein L3 glutamine methyltransferase
MRVMTFPDAAPNELQTIGDWWRFAISSLERANASFGQGTATPAEDASFLVLGTLELPLNSFETFREYRVTAAERAALFDALRERCVDHRPTAYILGFTEQLGLRFRVDERVLIPRSYLGEIIANEFAPWLGESDEPARILDLCTGSGCLAILCAQTFPSSTICASDISAEALELARENVADYFLEDEIDLRQGDLLEPWRNEVFDVIVCNPPYVTDESMSDLSAEFEHEPALALAGGEDGCDVLARLLPTVATHLSPKGLLFVDVGAYRELVERRFPRLPFSWISTDGAEDGVFMLSREDLER